MRLDHTINALITGGASGLGEATAKLFRQLKVNVIIADINQKKGESLAKQLGNVYLTQGCLFYKIDVTNQQQVKKLFEFIQIKFKNIHIVLNCAGISSPRPLIYKNQVIPSKILINLLMINVVGTFNVSKYAGKCIMNQPYISQEHKQRGVIINLSSILATEGTKLSITYSITKAAISGMTLPMAREFGKYGIRVMSIAPGPFDTPMTQSDWTPNFVKVINNTIPLGRIGYPKQFSQLVVSICENSFATGAEWRLDGGMRTPLL